MSLQRILTRRTAHIGLVVVATLTVLVLETLWGSMIIHHCMEKTPDRTVTLTFDDGPDPDVTPQVLKILEEHEVPAVFFVTGNRLQRFGGSVNYPAHLAILGSHSDTHRRMLTDSPRAQIHDLKTGAAVLDGYAGGGTRLYRPPRGQARASTVAWMKHDGYRMLGWSAAYDPFARHERARVRRALFTESIRPGDVILMHDTGPNSDMLLADLPHLISELKSRGYEFVVPVMD